MQVERKSFRSYVFYEAYGIKKWSKLPFGECLKRAWADYRRNFSKAVTQVKKSVKKVTAVKELTTEQLEKLARNINAFDLNYEYIDGSKYWFWSDLRDKIRKYTNQLSEQTKEQLKSLCDTEKADYLLV